MAKTISMETFIEKNNKTTLNIIDVREKFEYKLGGHIPGAKNLPLSKLQKNYTELDQKQEYYLVCQSGARSQQASDFLEQAGYQTTNVLGGMSMWSGKKER
ncbi:rhodanese-like domain-containing protein [Aerococcaceae bacterium DSM 111020]|nr:rhodanese-like domain-containing protein [Aerococcaceae bacterium DSM 111020]